MRDTLASQVLASVMISIAVCSTGCTNYFSPSDLPGPIQPANRAQLSGVSIAKPPNWHTNDHGDVLELTSREPTNRRLYGAKFLVQPGSYPHLKFAEQMFNGKKYLVSREFQPESGDRAPHTQFHFQVQGSRVWQVTFIAYADLQEIPAEILPYVDSVQEP